jgi:hypothetical protein
VIVTSVVTFNFVQYLKRHDNQQDSFNTYLTSGDKTKLSVSATCYVVDTHLNGTYISVLDTVHKIVEMMDELVFIFRQN